MRQWPAIAFFSPAASSGMSAITLLLLGLLKAGDHVLVMSNGGFQGIHNKLLEALISS